MADVFQDVSRACCALYTLEGTSSDCNIEDTTGYREGYCSILNYVKDKRGRRELVRPCVRLIGAFVGRFPSLAKEAQHALTEIVTRYVDKDDSVRFEDCVEALNGIGRIDGGVLQEDVLSKFVAMLMRVEEAEERRKGFAAALRACPRVSLKILCDMVNRKNIDDIEGKAGECVMASVVDDSMLLVSEYEPDLVMHGTVTNSVLESSIDRYGDATMLADCQRYMQALMVNISVNDTESVKGVMDRLTKRAFQRVKLGVADDEVDIDKEVVLDDMEEGELLDSVPVIAAPLGVENGSITGIVPKKIVHGIEIRGLPELVDLSVIRADCDKFTGVKDVVRQEEGSVVTVMCTSMPGTVRCYEAMCTRAEAFWSIGGLEKAPKVELAAYSEAVDAGMNVKHVHILLPGVEHAEQEDTIKETLREAHIEMPSSLTPLNVGMKGLILSFDKDVSVNMAFACLGGVEEEKESLKRSRDAADTTDEAHAKREKRDPPETLGQWSGQIIRNKQLQCSVVASVADGSLSSNAYGATEPLEWPQSLEVNQRADVKYLCDTLFPSTDARHKQMILFQPLQEADEKGLDSFDQYLRQKQRAGVVFLPPLSSASQRTMYLIPVTDDVCYRLQINRHRIPWPSMIGIVVHRP